MKNKKVMIEMLKIWGYPKKDWMGYPITKKNYVSYHHINEKRNGGLETVENGAILTRTSHLLLHRIELLNYDLYLKWQLLFLEINASRRPLDDYFLAKIGHLKRETKEFYASLNKQVKLTLTL